MATTSPTNDGLGAVPMSYSSPSPGPQIGGQAGAQGYNQSNAEFFLSNYRLGKTLGIGSFGKVKVAEHVLTGHKVAIKILNRKKIQAMDMEEKVRREIKILRLFMHPHIIRLYEVIETPSDIYVVMEYVKTGELFDYIVEKGRLMEDEARHFFQQIISGVEYCHRNMVVHRDLKPENLLLDSKMNVKIADFGLSNIMRDGHFLKTSCGSPNYAAPEVISGKLYAGPEVDVWSCGVILYALLCGSLPFDDENIPNLFKKIKGGIYNLPSHLSPGARDLIPRMLLVDPLKRITIPEIRQHPWFTLHLPRYLAVMQAEAVISSPRIDEDIVADVVRLGFERDMLLDSIRSRMQNKATVTYYLMCDNRRRLPSSGYLSAELSEGTGIYGGNALQPLPPNTLPGAAGGAPGNADRGSGGAPQQRVVAERRWRLGVHARGHPQTLMAELYRVLQASGVAWKKLSPYNLKCRAVMRVHQYSPRSTMSDDLDDEDRLEGMDAVQPSPSGNPLASAASSGSIPQHPLMQQAGGSLSRGSLGGPASGPPTPSAPIGIPQGGVVGVHAGAAQQGPGAVGRVDSGTAAVSGVVEGMDGDVRYRDLEVKFETQMYKVREDEYIIDIQRLAGDMFLYVDITGRIVAEMRV